MKWNKIWDSKWNEWAWQMSNGSRCGRVLDGLIGKKKKRNDNKGSNKNIVWWEEGSKRGGGGRISFRVGWNSFLQGKRLLREFLLGWKKKKRVGKVP